MTFLGVRQSRRSLLEVRRRFKPGVGSSQASVQGEIFIGLLSLFIYTRFSRLILVVHDCHINIVRHKYSPEFVDGGLILTNLTTNNLNHYKRVVGATIRGSLAVSSTMCHLQKNLIPF